MNYYNHKILNLIVDNILNLSLDELKDVYNLFDEGGFKEIDELKSKNIYLDFLQQEGVRSRQFDLPYFLNFNKENIFSLL